VTSLTQSRNAVGCAFALNGAIFATMVTRFPDVRRALGLSNGELGLLLLAASGGALLALPAAGWFIGRYGAGAVVRAGGLLTACGVIAAALGATGFALVPLCVVGLVAYGVGTSVWDVAMNVEGAEVERRLGRTIMPRFHAGWSLGSITGSGLGIPVVALDVPMVVHVGGGGMLAAIILWVTTRAFAPVSDASTGGAGSTDGRSAWLEPRTLAIGVMVLAFAAVEGTANDWLTLAVIDGYEQPHWVGVAAFAVFVVMMTLGRLLGVHGLDRFGRTRMLLGCAAAALTGSLLTVFGDALPIAIVGIAIWGLGASLGFPVGMSAAADDPLRAARRVSVVSTIGYGAFLILPPFLGWLGDRVGTLDSLLVVAVLMLPAALAVLAVRARSI